MPLFVLTRASSFLCRRCRQLQLRTGPPHEASSNENDPQPAHQLRSARRHGCFCEFLSRTKVEARRKLMTFYVLSLRTLSHSGRPGRPTSSSLASTYVLLLAILRVSWTLTGSPDLSADRRVHRLLTTGDARDGRGPDRERVEMYVLLRASTRLRRKLIRSRVWFTVLVGDDCPAFEGVYEFCTISAGGSISTFPSTHALHLLAASALTRAPSNLQVPLNDSTRAPLIRVSTGLEVSTTPRRGRRPGSATSTTSSSPSSSC